MTSRSVKMSLRGGASTTNKVSFGKFLLLNKFYIKQINTDKIKLNCQAICQGCNHFLKSTVIPLSLAFCVFPQLGNFLIQV